MSRLGLAQWPLTLWTELAKYSNNPELIWLVPSGVREEVVEQLYLRVPNAVVESLIRHQREDSLTSLESLRRRYPFDFTGHQVRLALERGRLAVVMIVQASGKLPDQAINYAARSGSIELVDYLIGLDFRPTEETLAAAAGGGHLPLVKHLYVNRVPISEEALAAAAGRGHLATLQWLLDPTGGGFSRPNMTRLARRWLREALSGGHLNVLRFLYDEIVRPDPDDYEVAYAYGHRVVIDELRRRGVGEITDRVAVLEKAIRADNLAVVRELHRAGVRLPRAVDIATAHGSLAVLKFLVQEGYEVSERHVQAAIYRGQYSMVVFLYQQGYEVDDDLRTATLILHPDLIDFFLARGRTPTNSDLFNVATHGSLTYFQRILDHLPATVRSSLDPTLIVSAAAGSGHLVLLTYLLEELRYPIDNRSIDRAVMYGHTTTVRYLARHGWRPNPIVIQSVLTNRSGVPVDIIKSFRDPFLAQLGRVNATSLELAKYFQRVAPNVIDWDPIGYVHQNDLSLLAYMIEVAGHHPPGTKTSGTSPPTRRRDRDYDWQEVIDEAAWRNRLAIVEYLRRYGLQPTKPP